MPGSRPDTKKTDESDFALQSEDMTAESARSITVYNGRVLDRPVRHRAVPVGSGQTKSVVICFHGRLIHHFCALCEYESEILSREQAK